MIAFPQIGLGTRLLLAEDCTRVVEQAIDIGYRYIDTAPIYGNEAAIGEGIRRSGISRDAMFVTTKVERDHLAAGAVVKSVEASLAALRLDHIDLLLIHWLNESVPLAETVAAMCALKKRGLLKHIGAANLTAALLDEAIALAARDGEVIAANQIEIHPSLPQQRLVAACRDRDVAVIAYSPMGRDDLQHPLVLGVATRLNRKPAQIVLRWHVQRGVLPIPIPDTASCDQVTEQYGISDFALSDQDMQDLRNVVPQKRYFDPAWAPKWDAPV
jgi:2,5-diketo-D-gluconate reductase B